jgi:geranylgeranyl diphosphate synthase type II
MRSRAEVAGYIDRARRAVDGHLATVLPADSPQALRDAMSYSLRAGGKRLRPVLCLAAADAVGGSAEACLPTACALELIHTYSLVHDDLPSMDDDSLRRGVPTLHVVVGEGMAILAGDGLLTEAFRVLAQQPAVDPTRLLRTVVLVAEAAGASGMVGGQALDIATPTPQAPGHAPALDAEALARMHAMKTGALIRASAVAGAVVAGGTEAQVAAIDTAAAEFGLAFQIVDDILDVEGDAAALGKTPGKDAAAGKSTYPALFGLAESKRLAAQCVERASVALAAADLAESWLLGIGRHIVERSS